VSDDPTPTAEQAPAVPPPAEQAPADDFDKERAMATIRQQREEAKALKAQLKELDTLRAEKEQRDQAELSATERLQKQLDKLQAEHSAATAELRRARLLSSARASAEKHALSFHPGALEDALTLGAFDTLEMADDGSVREMAEAVKRLAKERPYLLKPADVSADLDGTTRGKTSKADEDVSKAQERRNRWGIRSGV
jgi:multidrug efflux pump subunit AcrA (membrane-fusion protein)